MMKESDFDQPREDAIKTRLQNINNELIKIAADEHKRNTDLTHIHLRDARNLLDSVSGLKENRALSKATILLASAALESNLLFLANLALRFNEQQKKLLKPQIDFLCGSKEIIDENGRLVRQRLKQSLFERLQAIPKLLARTIDREHEIQNSSALFKKLQRTIERRDAIIHPRWNKYISEIGWWEAAEAIDAVELYLESIRTCIHPYLIGYTLMLHTVKGPHPDDMGVGYRTYGKRGPNRKISTMDEVGISKVMLNEWFDSIFVAKLAFGHQCEKDSDGSMLTRAALVLLYAMVDAQLAVVSQWKMRETPASFNEAELLFLNEFVVGVGHDGEVWVDDEQHSFKTNIKAIPSILARRIDSKEFALDLSAKWGGDLIKGNELRGKVMHTGIGVPVPRVSKAELMLSVKAIHSYFGELGQKLPITFKYMIGLITSADRLLAEA